MYIQRLPCCVAPQSPHIDGGLRKPEREFDVEPMSERQGRIEVPDKQIARIRLQVAVGVVVTEPRSRDRRAARDPPQLSHLPIGELPTNRLELVVLVFAHRSRISVSTRSAAPLLF